MATTTTNFGWDIPQSTDLVKDGATAIAALGQDIDTALVDLKGGTTGQVLAKASGTDLDFSWVAQDDSNAIQNTQLTAKGALISAFSSATPATLTVGTNGQVLTADSTTATGLAWATPASGSTFSGASVYRSSNLSCSGGTNTTVTWDTEEFDTGSYHSTSTNTERFTIPSGKSGKFLITTNFFPTDSVTVEFYLRKNGTNIRRFDITTSSTRTLGAHVVLDLVAGDYLYWDVYTGSTISLSSGTGSLMNWSISYLGA
jgi:hypothetical protein